MAAINRIPQAGERLKFVMNNWRLKEKQVLACKTFLITVREKDPEIDEVIYNEKGIISFIEDGESKFNCCIAANNSETQFNPYIFEVDAPRFQILSNKSFKGWKCLLEGCDTLEEALKVANDWADSIKQKQKHLTYKIDPEFYILDIGSA